MYSPCVKVQWFDSCCSEAKWEDPAHCIELDPVKVISCGRVYMESESHLTLVQSYTSNKVLNRICIPKKAISKIIRLIPKESQ